MKTEHITIDSEIAQELKIFTLEKHQKIRGAMKLEVEAAIIAHIRGGNNGPGR